MSDEIEPNLKLKEFLFLEDWLSKRYERLEFVRSEKWWTFKVALNLFLQRRGDLIVETGTMRTHDDPGGSSTLLFGDFCKHYNKTLITVDISPENIAFSMKETLAFKDNIIYVVSDSVKFLNHMKGDIDLLYLDSMDCDVEGDSTPAQAHNVAEYMAARDKLRVGSIILIDDNNFKNGGKTKLTKDLLLMEKNCECVLDWGQTIWTKIR